MSQDLSKISQLLQASQEHPLVIMDEIDSGLGSRLGTSVGRMLRSMASSQILCISHLAQVRPLARLHSLCMLASHHRGHAKQPKPG